MNFLKDILLQLFFLFFPLLLYYCFVHKHFNKLSELRRQLVASLYCSASVLLCLSFPITISGGHLYNLSAIPVIMSILYGGYLSGLITVLVFFSYPLVFNGGADFIHTYVLVPFLILLPAFLQPRWKEYTKNQKYTFTLILASVKLPLLYLALFFQYFWGTMTTNLKEGLLLATWSSHIFIFATMFTLYLIEYYCDLDKLQMQVKKMRKLQHVSELADDVSQEFQKPLTLAKGFTQLLGAEKNKTNKEYVPVILSELKRAEKIIDSYIKIAKTHTFPSKTISSKELIDVVMEGMQTYAHNNKVELKTDKLRNLRLRGNIDLLSESFSSILKFGIDSLEIKGSKGTLKIKNYLHDNEVIFEILDSEGRMKRSQLNLLHDYAALMEDETNHHLHSACSILFAHGGDVEVKRKIRNKTAISLTIPAHVKKRNTLHSRVKKHLPS